MEKIEINGVNENVISIKGREEREKRCRKKR
jgi:hypothetical protein